MATALAPVNGKLSLRFMEPMEEVNYIDQLRLVAVDHPENVEVNPDERFLDDPPFASGRVVASQGARLPVGAWDGEGRDVLDASEPARSPVCQRIHSDALRRVCQSAHADARSGRCGRAAPLRLLMTGYVNYFSATSLYARVAGGDQADFAVRRSAVAGWHVAADSRRCGFSGRSGADDRRGSDGQAARRRAHAFGWSRIWKSTGTRC